MQRFTCAPSPAGVDLAVIQHTPNEFEIEHDWGDGVTTPRFVCLNREQAIEVRDLLTRLLGEEAEGRDRAG